MPDSDGIRQAQVRGSSALPSPPGGIADIPRFSLACEQQTDRKYVRCAQATPSSSHFKTKVTVTPQKELSGDGIEQKRFYIKGKAYSVVFRPTHDETFHVRQTRAEGAKSYSCILSF